MTQKKLTLDERVEIFIHNIIEHNAQESLDMVVKSLLDPEDTQLIPVRDTPENFMYMLIKYYEHVENYELCNNMKKHEEQMLSRMIPEAPVQSLSDIIMQLLKENGLNL